MNTAEFLMIASSVVPDRAALVCEATTRTYAELQERVNRLASALRKAGMKKHDRVAFICPNIPAMLEAHYGVPLAGGILVAINIRLSSDEIGYILKHSGSKFLFVDAEFEPVIKPLDLSGLNVIRVDDTGAAGPRNRVDRNATRLARFQHHAGTAGPLHPGPGCRRPGRRRPRPLAARRSRRRGGGRLRRRCAGRGSSRPR